MIAPEYFNNHIAIEGEIIVKRVPNDTGSVLVWNSTTKKISTRTVSEIVSDLSLMTTNTEQIISGRKWFYTSGGSNWDNSTLGIMSQDGSNPTLAFYKGGTNIAGLNYDGGTFHFNNNGNVTDYSMIRAAGIYKNGSDNDHVLLGGGNHKPLSEFVSTNHTHISLENNQNNDSVDSHTLLEDNKFKFIHRITAGQPNLFPTHNNANSIVAIATHQGGYGNLLGFNSDGDAFIKNVSAGNYSPTWKQFAYKDWVSSNYMPQTHPIFSYGQSQFDDWTNNKINGIPFIYTDPSKDANNITKSGFYLIGHGTLNSGGYTGNIDGARAMLHFETEGTYSATQIQNERHSGNLVLRSKSDGNWTGWIRQWGDNDFNQSHVDYLKYLTFNGAATIAMLESYWKIWSNSSNQKGFQSNSSFYFLTLSETAQRIATGGVLASDNYADISLVPSVGAYIKGQIATGAHGDSGQWNLGYSKNVSNFVKTFGNYGDSYKFIRSDGTELERVYFGVGVVDTRNQNNGLGSDGNAEYVPFSNSDALDHKLTPIFHNTSRGWSSSLILKGWNSHYKAWKITGDANADDTERDLYLSNSKSSDGTWLPERMIWTDRYFSITDITNWNASYNWGNHALEGYLKTASLNGYATENYVIQNFISNSQKGIANGVATLDSSGLVPASQLPSYVDDVLEFGSLGNFPSTGETGKIYVATDTNQTYRWSGSTYIQIASGAVQSVNGQTGIVNLTKTDVGLVNVDNTADAIKNVATAGSLRNVNISLAQLNSVTLEPGIYNAEGFNPGQGLTADYHYIIQLGSYTSGGYRAQIAIPYSNGTNDSMYIRTAVGGNWGLWERIAKNSDITAAINALNLGNYATFSQLNEKVSKAGDTMTGMISFANNAGGLQGTMGDNDFWRIVGRSNGSDNGYLEIATADGGIEPIHIRQYYDGDFTSLVRTATLLDESGNTHFPRNITAGNAINAGSDSQISGRIFGKREIIDATALNEDTYYPIPINLPTNYPSKIKVYRSLDSSMGTPSYSHHGAGFWCYFEFEDYGRGWGVTDNFSLCNYQQKAWTDIIPVGYSIINESSHSVIWIRGGSKYWVDVNSSTEIILYPNGYTSPHGQTVNPTTIRPWVDINKNTTSRDLTNYWNKTEFNPATKANALENAAGIGFSSGNYPTHNGGDYPYMYFNNGTTQDYIALATQAFVNWKLDNHTHKSLYSDAVGSVDANTLMESYKFRFDTVVAPSSANMFPNAVDNANAILSISSHPGYGVQFGFNTFGETYTRRLQNGSWNTWDKIITLNNGSQNFITTDTLAQSKTGNLNFIEGAVMSVTGADSNAILSYSQTSGNTGVVSAWLYKHYNTIWKVGNKRGGSTDSLGYAFQFATDGGTTYDEKVLFTPEGNILTSSHGSADVWNSKVSQSQLSNYVPYTGSNQNIDINQKQLTNASLVESKGYRFTSHSAGPYGKITTGSSFFAMGGTFGYGISTNQGGGLDIMANQGGQAIRFWAGNDNDNPYYVSQFYKEMSSFFTSLSLENGKELRLKGADDIAHSILHFSDDYDGFKISSGFAVRDYASLNNLFRVTAAGFGEFNQNVRASGFLKTGSSNDYVLLGQGDHKPLSEFATNDYLPNQSWGGHQAISGRRTVGELAWKNYGSGHTIFDISSSTTPWGVSKSNVDAEVPWSPSYPTLVGGNGAYTYGVRVDNARISDNTNALGGVGSAGWVRNMENAYGIGFQSGNVNLAPYFYHSNGTYKFLATQEWVNTNFIPKSHPVYNITQADINSWNAGSGGSSHTHSNLNLLNNIDQWLGVGQAPSFGSVRLMNYLGYGHLALEEGYFGSEMGLVDLSNNVIYAGRENEYLKYGSSVNNFEGLNIHFDAKLLSIGKEVTNHEDKVQLAGNISVDTISAFGDDMQLILNPLYNTDGDVRGSRNAHIYIVTRGTVILPSKPILGQRIEIFNYSKNDIEVMHDNVGTLFILPPFGKVTGIVGGKGFIFDEKPVFAKQYDI